MWTAPRSRASSASRSSSAFSASRERRIRSAVCLFEDCERSFWTLTTIPVGRCVIRTRVGLVHVLAAGAAGPVRVDAQVVLVHLDLAVLAQERGRDHLGEGRVAPVRLVEGREADEPVLAALRLQHAVGVLALDREGGGLEARLLA